MENTNFNAQLASDHHDPSVPSYVYMPIDKKTYMPIEGAGLRRGYFDSWSDPTSNYERYTEYFKSPYCGYSFPSYFLVPETLERIPFKYDDPVKMCWAYKKLQAGGTLPLNEGMLLRSGKYKNPNEPFVRTDRHDSYPC